jgi:hypothetical protein
VHLVERRDALDAREHAHRPDEDRERDADEGAPTGRGAFLLPRAETEPEAQQCRQLEKQGVHGVQAPWPLWIDRKRPENEGEKPTVGRRSGGRAPAGCRLAAHPLPQGCAPAARPGNLRAWRCGPS